MHEEMKATGAAEDAQHGKDRRGDELPPELRGKRERLAQLEQAKERLIPTTKFIAWHLSGSYSFACEKGTPDDFAAESTEQAKSPFQYQRFSSARLLVATA